MIAGPFFCRLFLWSHNFIFSLEVEAGLSEKQLRANHTFGKRNLLREKGASRAF